MADAMFVLRALPSMDAQAPVHSIPPRWPTSDDCARPDSRAPPGVAPSSKSKACLVVVCLHARLHNSSAVLHCAPCLFVNEQPPPTNSSTSRQHHQPPGSSSLHSVPHDTGNQPILKAAAACMKPQLSLARNAKDGSALQICVSGGHPLLGDVKLVTVSHVCRSTLSECLRAVSGGISVVFLNSLFMRRTPAEQSKPCQRNSPAAAAGELR